MSFIDGLMNYDLECDILDSNGSVISKFKAREFTPYERQSSPVLGGIASLGHTYSIATKSVDLELIPNNHNLRINGNIFVITGTTIYSRRPPYGKNLGIPPKDETVVYLE